VSDGEDSPYADRASHDHRVVLRNTYKDDSENGGRVFVQRKIAAVALSIIALWTLIIHTGLSHISSLIDVRLIPREYLFNSSSFSVMLSVILLITCYYLARGKKLAWYASTGTLSLSILLHILHRSRGIDPVLLFSIAMIFFLILYKDQFRTPGRLSLQKLNRTREVAHMLGIFGVVVLTSAAAFYVHRDVFSPRLDVAGSLWLSLLSSIMADTTGIFHPLNSRADILIESVTVAYITIYAYATSFFFTWFLKKGRTWAGNTSPLTTITLDQIIDAHGRHAINCFAASPEKQIFINSDKSCMLSLRVISGTGLVLGDPIGPDAKSEQVIREFRSFCMNSDLVPAFYHAHHSNIPSYQRAGMKEIKIGEEAIINPSTFELAGPKKKNLRNSVAAAERQGIAVRIFQAGQIICDEQLCSELDRISADWQSSGGGRRNIGFSCTKIHSVSDLLKGCREEEERTERDNLPGSSLIVAIAYRSGSNNNGQEEDDHGSSKNPCAFAIVRIYPNNRGATLDALRRTRDSPNGAVEILLYKTILTLKTLPRIREFSLGLAPLADSLNEVGMRGRGKFRVESVIETLAFSLGRNTTAVYNYNQLFRFKSKFDPRWEPRYLIVPSIANLPKILYSITKAHLQ
jgi:phosphatidylglycerol lysyltransferase